MQWKHFPRVKTLGPDQILVNGSRWGALVVWLLGAAVEVLGAEVGIVREGDSTQLRLQGGEGQEYSIESVERLLNGGREWKSIATVSPANRPVMFYDPMCTTRPQNFYRLRLMQGAVAVEVPNFRLIDGNGLAQELFYQTDARAMVLVFAGAGLDGLRETATELARVAALDGVRVWVLAQADAADRERLKAQAAGLGLTVPILEDEGGAVTRSMGVEAVPEAMVLDPGRWSVIYRGRIVDVISAAAEGGHRTLLRDAVNQFRSGERVVIRRALSDGQPLSSTVHGSKTYEADVAPLLQRSCVPCHSPGNIAPWAMTNHTVIREYGPLIRDEILTRRMPPWHADRRPQS